MRGLGPGCPLKWVVYYRYNSVNRVFLRFLAYIFEEYINSLHLSIRVSYRKPYKMAPSDQPDILEFLASKKWMLLVLAELHFHGTQRFNELLDNMKQVSPKILSKRLKELEARELVERRKYNEIPPRVEYTLTAKGEDLVKSFKDIGSWAIKWESE